MIVFNEFFPSLKKGEKPLYSFAQEMGRLCRQEGEVLLHGRKQGRS